MRPDERDRRAGALDPAGSDRRSALRIETHHNAACRISSVRYVVEVADVSRTGARLKVRVGLVPAAGQRVALTFPGRAPVEAVVVWSQADSVGITFIEALADPDEAVHFDDLGADYFRALLKYRIAGC